MKILYVAIISLCISSCWPSSISFKDVGSMPEEWKVFSISTLENIAPNAPTNYPAQLSEDIRDGIQNNTRLKLNTSPGTGEIRINGSITNYSITPIALQPGDNAAKNRLSISTKFTILTLKPKEQEFQVTSERFADYSSDQDFSTVEKSLIEEINKQIVQDIINKLLSNW